tara:strand:- start:265 stop:852 length:588 start_codon:yes stop_codon:yes gene_type:complete
VSEVAVDPPVDVDVDDRTDRLRASAQGMFVWAVLGLLLGGIGPGVAALLIDDGVEFAGFIVSSELFGLFSGLLLGLLDMPRRLPARPWRPLVAGLIGLPMGVVWAGSAGVAGGAGMIAIMSLFSSPPDPLGALAVFGFFGGVLGAVVGTPGVAVFCAVRGWTLNSGMPWWLAHVAALVVTAILSFPGFLLVLGGI